MNVPKVFLDNWRAGYKKMIDDAHEAVVTEMYKDLPPYVSSEHPSQKNLFRRFARRFRSGEGSWDDFWEKIDRDEAYSMSVAIDRSDKLVREHPEYAAKHNGLKDLLLDIGMMDLTAEKSSDKWLMRVLKDFREIYRDNPDLCDYDAMVAFVKLEELSKKPEQVRALGAVPRDICEGLDLGFSRNLKKYIDRYVTFVEADGAASEGDASSITLTYGDYGDRVARGEDGVYRWTYDRKSQGKPLPRKLYWRCFMLPALLFLIVGVLPFAIFAPVVGYISEETGGVGTYVLTLLRAILMFAVVSALIGALVYRINYKKRVIRYEMTENGVRAFSRSSEKIDFVHVKHYELIPECDLIQLSKLGMPIYAPPEDYDMIRDFIQARLPAGAKRL